MQITVNKQLEDFDLNPDIHLDEYITKYSPEFFFGYLVIKEDSNNTGTAFINAFKNTYKEINNTAIKVNVWVIPEERYSKVINEFSFLPKLSNDWFRDKNALVHFPFYKEKDGTNIDEIEVDKYFKGEKR